MSTQSNDSLEAKINALGLKVGNQVLSATGVAATASVPMYIDSDSRLAQGAIPFAVPITPSASTAKFLSLTGAATSDVMTTNVVVDGAGGATTFTKKAYIKITITDTGGVATNGDYYIQVGTLT